MPTYRLLVLLATSSHMMTVGNKTLNRVIPMTVRSGEETEALSTPDSVAILLLSPGFGKKGICKNEQLDLGR